MVSLALIPSEQCLLQLQDVLVIACKRQRQKFMFGHSRSLICFDHPIYSLIEEKRAGDKSYDDHKNQYACTFPTHTVNEIHEVPHCWLDEKNHSYYLWDFVLIPLVLTFLVVFEELLYFHSFEHLLILILTLNSSFPLYNDYYITFFQERGTSTNTMSRRWNALPWTGIVFLMVLFRCSFQAHQKLRPD